MTMSGWDGFHAGIQALQRAAAGGGGYVPSPTDGRSTVQDDGRLFYEAPGDASGLVQYNEPGDASGFVRAPHIAPGTVLYDDFWR